MTNPENQLIDQRLQKLEEIRKLGIEPYPYSYKTNTTAKEIKEKFSKLKNEEKTKAKVSLSGRLMTIRRMGKASFAHLQDHTDKVQFYIREDEVGNSEYEIFKKLDMGDIIGIEGIIFKTKTGEVSIWIKKLTFLSKCLRPLPEKWHGLKDVEARYRQRYLDLIANPEVKEIFIKRSKIVSAVREFLEMKGYIEVDIPTLQPQYGGANAKPFKTHINAWNIDLYLSISPELYLKKLIVGGFDKVFTICKNFRNEGVDKTHNPEFTMMECYAINEDYNYLLELIEDLYIYAAEKVLGTTKITYQGQKIDLKKPWKRLTMYESLKQYANLDVSKMSDKELIKQANSHGVQIEKNTPRGLIIEALFGELVEKHLIQPTHLIDHPKETTPLCKVKRGDECLIERVEPYINGWEIGNGYSELNDPKIQYELFKEQEERGRAGNEEFHPMDEDYVKALETGLPPTAGVGLGIDRMVMLLTDSTTIRDVILFPTMRPENKDEEKITKENILEQEGKIVGKVVKIEKHPNADNLKICTINIGN